MSNIRVAQASMQYVPALQRPGCRTCTQSRAASPGEHGPLRCGPGGFATSPFAICAKHEPRHAAPTQKGSS